MVRFLMAVFDGMVRLRCPVCHRGALFPKVLTYRLNEVCPVCGVRFMPDRGEIAGGMAINMVLTSILGVAGVIYLAVFAELSAPVALAWIVGLPALFAVWFNRHASGLWVAMLHVTRAMDERHPLASRATGRRAPGSVGATRTDESAGTTEEDPSG